MLKTLLLRTAGSCPDEKGGREVTVSRLRRYPRWKFESVGGRVLRVVFELNGTIEEGRAESLSEDVNLEDDAVTWDSSANEFDLDSFITGSRLGVGDISFEIVTWRGKVETSSDVTFDDNSREDSDNAGVDAEGCIIGSEVEPEVSCKSLKV